MLKALARLFKRAAPPPAAAPVASARQVPIEALLAAPLNALDEGRLEEAAAQLEAVVERHPEAAEAHALLAHVLQRLKRPEDARDHYLLAIAFAPESPQPRFELGLLMLDEGRYADACDALTHAVELEPGNARAHNALGAACIYLERIEDASRHLRTAIELDPECADAHTISGICSCATSSGTTKARGT